MERIESLAAKLGHHLPDIRSRAASNLLFKLESGVVDGSVLGSAHCLSVLSAALHSALRSCVERVSAGGTPEDGYVRALLGTLRVVGRCAIKDESAGTLSQTLSTLYEMSTSSAFAAHSQAISEAIECICTVNSDILSTAAGQMDKADRTQEQHGTTQQSPHRRSERAVSAFSLPHSPAAVRPRPGQRRGAGAILESSLATDGWKFPKFVLTEADDRFLFDIEVKLKMGQEGVHLPLLGLIGDFPAQCLLQRAGLISELLDVVGTPVVCSSAAPSPVGDCALPTHPMGADPSGYMTPLAALDWFDRLLDKMKSEYGTQVEGSLSSGAGPRMPSTGADGASTAFRMAAVMHSYRYPRELPPFSEMQPEDDVPITSPGGSLSGTAFAICAAVMPLLRSGDVSVCSAALSVLQKSVPLCMEPIYGLGGADPLQELLRVGVSEDEALDLMGRVATLCTERLQHLISRLEQLLACRDKFRYADMAGEVVDACSGSQPAADSLEALSALSCDLCLFRASAAVLALLPASFSCTSAVADRDFTSSSEIPRFVFGSNVTAALADIAATSCLENAENNYLLALETIDPATALDILEVKEFVYSYSRLVVCSLELDPSAAEQLEDALLEGVARAEQCVGVIEKSAASSAACAQIIDDELCGEFEQHICTLLLRVSSYFCDVERKEDRSMLTRLVRVLRQLLRLSGPTPSDAGLRVDKVCDNVLNLLLAVDQAVRDDMNEDAGGCLRGLSSAMVSTDGDSGLSFLRDLIVFGLLRGNDLSSECDNIPLKLVDMLLAFQLDAYECCSAEGTCRRDEQTALLARQYADILGPLKLLVWSVRALDASEGCICPNVIRFTEVLQDACTVTVDGFHPPDTLDAEETTSIRYLFERSMLMGLFHESKRVRKETLLRAAHCYGLHSKSWRDNTLLGHQQTNGFSSLCGVLDAADPGAVAASTSVELAYVDWDESSDSGSHSEVSGLKHDMSFQDLHNLGQVAFCTDVELSCDASVRLAALSQIVVAVTSRDEAMLKAVNDDVVARGGASWAATAVAFVADLLERMSSALMDSDYSGPMPSTPNTEFVVLSLVLLHAVLHAAPQIGRIVTFFEKSSFSTRNASVFSFRSVLNILFSSNPDNKVPELSTIQLHCWRVLCTWCCCWTSRAGRAAVPAFVAASLKRVCGPQAIPEDRTIPAAASPLVITDTSPLLTPTDAENFSRRIIGVIRGCKDKELCLSSSPYLNDRMQQSRSHTQFNQWIVVTTCLCGAFPSLLGDIVSPTEGRGLLDSFSNILKSAPNTEFDIITLHHSLRLLCPALAAVDDSSGDVAGEFCRVVIEFAYSLQTTEFIESIIFPDFKTKSKKCNATSTTSGRRSEQHRVFSLLALEDLLTFMLRVATTRVVWQHAFVKQLLEGSPLVVLICRLACTEALPCILRLRAWSLLEVLASVYPDETVVALEYTAEEYWSHTGNNMDFLPGRLAKQPFEKSAILNALYDTSTTSYSPIADVASCARLLRTPDSMIGSSSAFGALRVMQSVHRMRYNGPYADVRAPKLIGINQTCEGMAYPWLLRYIHDRHGVIRALAVDIIETTIDLKVHALKVSCLEPAAAGEGMTLPSPLSNLKHIVLDNSECTATRTAAMRILSRFLLILSSHLSNESRAAVSDGPNVVGGVTGAYTTILSTLLCGISFCLDESGSATAVRESISIWESLLSCGNLNDGWNLLTHTLRMAIPHKIVVRVVAAIETGAVISVTDSRCRDRVLAGYCGVIGQRLTPSHNSLVRAAALPPNHVELFRATAFNRALETIAQHHLEHSFVAQVKAMRVCQRLSEIDRTSRIRKPVVHFFSDCVRRTNLVRNVIGLFSSLDTMGTEDYLMFGLRSKACVDILSAMMLQDYYMGRGGIVDPSYFGITSMVTGNSALIANVVVVLAISLVKLVDDGCLHDTSDLPESLDLLTSYLRLVGLMLGSEQWRSGMCLGPAFKHSIEDSTGERQQRAGAGVDPAVSLLDALQVVHTALDAQHFEDISAVDAVYSRLEAVLGLLLHHSYKLRCVFSSNECADSGSGSESDAAVSETEPINRLSWCLGSLHIAMSLVQTPPVVPELRLLKSKTSVKAKAGSLSSARPTGGGDVDGSALSAHSTPPRNRPGRANNVKYPDSIAVVEESNRPRRLVRGGQIKANWREKVRGYDVESSLKIESPSAPKWYLEPSVRRRFWALLVFLQGALVDCNQLQRVCKTAGLDQLLGDVLKLVPVWLKCGTVDEKSFDSVWSPSFGNLAVAALACLAALMHHTRLNTPPVVSAGEHEAANSDLHVIRLLSLGLDNGGTGVGTPLVMQWLSLQISGAFLLGPPACSGVSTPVSPPTKTLIVRSLYRSIQSNLQSHSSSFNSSRNSLEDMYRQTCTNKGGPDLLSHLNFALLSNQMTMSLAVDVLACVGSTHVYITGRDNATGGLAGKGHLKGPGCAVLSSSSLGASSAPHSRRSVRSQKADVKDADFLPLPDIIKWLADTGAEDNMFFAASLSRFIGRLSTGNCKNACAAATSEVTLGTITNIVAECFSIEADGARDAVLLASSVALWTIVHSSEKAKAVIKSSDYNNCIPWTQDVKGHPLVVSALAALQEAFAPTTTDNFDVW